MVRIGMMSFAHMHAESYAVSLNTLTSAELACIADDNAERGRAMAAKFGTTYLESYEKLLASGIDAVIICSENSAHKELATMAARAGKHILCEKPISTNLADAEEIIESCRECGVKLMIAFPCRYSPAMVKLANTVKSGAIGEVLAIKATNHGKMPGGWFVEKEKSGGGCVIDHTVHVIDLVRSMLGVEPASVYAQTGNGLYHRDFDDTGLLSVTMANGVFLSLDTSWSRPESFPIWGDVTMSVIGTLGCADMDMFAENLGLYPGSRGTAEYIGFGENTDARMLADFIRCVSEDTEPTISGTDGAAALAVALAAYESAASGRVATIPSQEYQNKNHNQRYRRY